MLTNIKRVVDEDVSNRITQMDVIYEAITNAIHANAIKIVCRLSSDQKALEDNDGELVSRKVTSIEVEDNGDGFDEQNYNSFWKYRTDHKIKLGCKGVGRFVFLKVFERIIFTSWLAKSSVKRTFTFDDDSDNLKDDKETIKENRTILGLSVVTPKYFNIDNNIDRRIDLNLSQIREKVLSYLIPMLFLYKQKKVNIQIEFQDTETGEQVDISNINIPDFASTSFSADGVDNKTYPFTLYHIISAGGGRLNAFYCANDRTVREFSDEDFKISLPNDFEAYFLLKSPYFDEHINNEKNKFDINPVKTDFFSPLSWEMINNKLKNTIAALIKDIIPDAVKMNIEKLTEIQNERPYLTDYIEPEDLDIAGFMDKPQIIKKAKKRFDDAKENLLTHAGKLEYTGQELQEAIQITQNELVAYIKYRVLVIERLKVMIENKEQSEKLIHNLFMERNSDDDCCCAGKNNLWLLDDRFTSYSYAASDKRIKEIIEQLKMENGTDYDNNDRPDLALFYSHDPANKNALKSVLIELKSFKDKKKFDRDKYVGILQLQDYIKAFKTKEDIKEIWAFLVTDVDDKFADKLKDNEFTPLFSTEKAIYYKYFSNIGYIYVFGVQTLIADAEARNKIFIDIINKHSRLNKMITTHFTQSEGQIDGIS